MIAGTKGPLGDASAFRVAVVDVRRVIDESGERLDQIALQCSDTWQLLPLRSLLSGRPDQLASLIFRLAVDESLAAENLRALSHEIVEAAKEDLLWLPAAGYVKVPFKEDGTAAEGFVWGSKVHWFGAPPPIPWTCGDGLRPVELASCTEDEWKAAVGQTFARNPYLMVILGAALYAALARPLKLPTMALAIIGESSSGKSAGQKIVMSATGAGTVMESTDATTVGLQQSLVEHADRAVFLEDFGLLDEPEKFARVLFSAANGGKRTVGTQQQKATVARALSCTVIASNERSVYEVAQRGKRAVEAGLGARLWELHACGPYGMFHSLPSGKTAAAFADRLKQIAEEKYGAVWPRWIHHIAKNMEIIRRRALKDMPLRRQYFEQKFGVTDAIAKRQLIPYVGWEMAALLAVRFGLVSATIAEVKKAFKLVLKEHQERMKLGGGADSLISSVVNALSDAFMQHPEKVVDFKLYGKAASPLAYRHFVDGRRCLLVEDGVFTRLVTPFSKRDAMRALARAGLLVSKSGVGSEPHHLPGTRNQKRRFVTIDEGICFEPQSDKSDQ